ncbi:MAG: PfkB family carbohydrate kinase [Clostridiaceae bacterium]|nr:PfkB family carbohydrate kinase [Clostridiaceae bacterium]
MEYANELREFGYMKEERFEKILADIGGVRAALAGDLCLDAYWRADMTRSELSRETPHFPLPVVEERYAPGAGGNAAANIAALRPKSIAAVGAIGQDWRGDVLLRELSARGIDVSRVIRHPDRITNAYIKPCRRGISEIEYEDPRLDFENFTAQPKDLDEAVMAELEKLSSSIDVLCVSDQFRLGCITDAVRGKLAALASAGLKIIVDSRYRIGLYSGCVLKPNELEGTAAVGAELRSGDSGLAAYAAAARSLSQRAGSPVCMTLGGQGCIVTSVAGPACHVPGVGVESPLDICGAGDTFLAAFSCALAAGAEMEEAAYIANLSASVTIKKLGQTGTACPEEIRARYRERNRA